MSSWPVSIVCWPEETTISVLGRGLRRASQRAIWRLTLELQLINSPSGGQLRHRLSVPSPRSTT